VARPQFLGRWDCIIDDKRRLTLPAPVRKKLVEMNESPELISTIGHRGSLLLIPPSIWDEFARDLFQAPVQGDRDALLLRGRMARYGGHCKLDSSGRVTLSEEQLKVAELTRDAIVFGNFSRIEVWNPEHFERAYPPITDPAEHDQLAERYLSQKGI